MGGWYSKGNRESGIGNRECGEMGRWGDGEMGRWYIQLSYPDSRLSTPDSLLPTAYFLLPIPY
ncbi:MAG: hypothetical protein F6K52_10700 [Moorea sp. SIO3H5]|nr:hypothetical protein [Moorena sp. SIO3H5]